ncbi:hypothetical protein GGR57DRAFT_509018 [Xylariaceae sp. FL1272]|nr:hypothetical protein GGR57DRAFT_509018 [Xylariaceae sp. FL1272]
MPMNLFNNLSVGGPFHSNRQGAKRSPSPSPFSDPEDPFSSPEDKQAELKSEYAEQSIELRKYSVNVRDHLDILAAISEELSRQNLVLRRLDKAQNKLKPSYVSILKKSRKLLERRDELRRQLDANLEDPIPATGYAPYDLSSDSEFNELNLLALQLEQKKLSIIRDSRILLYSTIERLGNGCLHVEDEAAQRAMYGEMAAHLFLQSPHAFDYIMKRHAEVTTEVSRLEAGVIRAEASDSESEVET